MKVGEGSASSANQSVAIAHAWSVHEKLLVRTRAISAVCMDGRSKAAIQRSALQLLFRRLVAMSGGGLGILRSWACFMKQEWGMAASESGPS